MVRLKNIDWSEYSVDNYTEGYSDIYDGKLRTRMDGYLSELLPFQGT